MKAIQGLVYAFSGINIFAKATASSMNNTASSANKASKSLSGVHGEITNVSENNGGGSGSVSPSMDLSQVDTSINKWAEKFKATIGNVGTAFKKAWENNGGTEIIQNLWNGLNNLLGIVEGVGQVFQEWTASESFQEFANSIVEICLTLSSWFDLITQKLTQIWENSGKQTFSKLLEFISKLVTAISSIIAFLSPVIEFVLNIVTPVINGIIEVIGYVIDALSGILDFIIGVFTGDWERAWEGIKEFFVGIWNALKTIVVTVFNFIKDIITNVLNAIKAIWNTVWSWIKTLATSIWEGIKTTISNVIQKIKTTISNILNSIKTTWNNIWNGIKTTVVNIWNGIWGAIKSVINSILGGIESFVNGVIKGINKILSGISSVANAVGSLIGLDPINLQLSTISLPRLAKGNVAYSETVAVFGEYTGASNNPEITTPQNVMAETFRDVLSDYEYSNNKSNGEIKQIVFQFGSYRVAVEMEKLLQQARRQNGTATITV